MLTERDAQWSYPKVFLPKDFLFERSSHQERSYQEIYIQRSLKGLKRFQWNGECIQMYTKFFKVCITGPSLLWLKVLSTRKCANELSWKCLRHPEPAAYRWRFAALQGGCLVKPFGETVRWDCSVSLFIGSLALRRRTAARKSNSNGKNSEFFHNNPGY